MLGYSIIIAMVFLYQVIVFIIAYSQSRFVLDKYRPKASKYRPRVALIAPCKGIDTTFDRNVRSLLALDYPDYEIYFVVESRDDPAHAFLQRVIAEERQVGHVVPMHLLVAGIAVDCGQKVHNLLAACDAVDDNVEVLAFVDSDVCVKRHWLASLVRPLRRSNAGASTGYRLFVPTDSRLSSMALSAINVLIASFLGPHRWNFAWGGSMAIRREFFDVINLRQAWSHVCTDDYTLTAAVKRANRRVHFTPACLVASYEQMSWVQLFSFARRQFIITRVYVKHLWNLWILNIGLYLLMFWGSLGFATYLFGVDSPQAWQGMILPAFLMLTSMIKGILRQCLVRKILPEDWPKLRGPALLDVFCQPLLSIFTFVCLMASAGTRKIIWRGVCYELHDTHNMEVRHLRSANNGTVQP